MGATVAEFFAGIGMFRLGMESAGHRVVWANDISPMKQSVYEANFGAEEFLLRDIRDVTGDEVPAVDVAVAGSPCVDVSLAGNQAGIAGERSRVFFDFVRVLDEMGERRPARLIFENVPGLILSNDGRDLRKVVSEFNGLGYVCDLMVVDASCFVPQSRRRLFVIAEQNCNVSERDAHVAAGPARDRVLARWIASNADLGLALRPLTQAPERESVRLSDVMQRIDESDQRWWDDARMSDFESRISPCHRSVLLQPPMFDCGERWFSANQHGRGGRNMWEIRGDEIAQCLTAARGGSNRTAAIRVNADGYRGRWINGRECARLQGAPDSYDISMLTEDQARMCFGDAVCVPVAAWVSGLL